MQLGLYVHIPFCRQKCLYCDFPSYAGKESLMECYAAALCREITVQGGLFSGAFVDTVYIGGGTPTALPRQLLKKIIMAVKSSFSLQPTAEFTVEANPGTVNLSLLEDMRQWGVNRISFGVQSFQDALLRGIGRLHTADAAAIAVSAAHEAGLQNISLDLMYGLPCQTLKDVVESIQKAVSLPIKHISIYGLQVEAGTPFASFAEAGKLALPETDEEAAMYAYIMEELPSLGFSRYEISNFAMPGFESRHNLRYWQYRPYLGLGAAAHSFVGARRFSNAPDVEEYITRSEGDKPTAVFAEELTACMQMEEFCFLALRMRAGIDGKVFEKRFDREFLSLYAHKIKGLTRQGLLEEVDGSYRLTTRGMQYGNRVFAEFLLDS